MSTPSPTAPNRPLRARPGLFPTHPETGSLSRLGLATLGLLVVLSAFTAQAAPAQTPDGEDPAARPPAAEGPSSSFTESVEVRLVEVEVAVQDKKGRPVMGLSRDEFELIVDGKAHSIDTFGQLGELPPSSPPPSAISSDQSGSDQGGSATGTEVAFSSPAKGADSESLYLCVYVDRNFLEKVGFESAKQDLKRFLRANIGPGDQVLLAESGEELQVLAPFGTHLDDVVALVDGLSGTGKGGKLASDYLFQMRYLQRLTQDRRRQQAGVYQPALEKVLAFYGESLGEMDRTGRYLSRLIDHLAGLPGRRQMLYVGGPIPTVAGLRLFEQWRDTFERSTGADAINQGDGTSFRITSLAQEVQAKRKGFQAGIDVFGRLADAASANGVVVHTLGLTTIRNSRNAVASRVDVTRGSIGEITSTPDFLSDSRATLEMDEGLRLLSGRTGGTHFEGYKNIDRFFDGLEEDLRRRYLIGFYAPATDTELKVKVKLVRGRLKLVRHRRLVRVESTAQELATRTRSALLDRSRTENPLGARLTISSLRQEGDEWVIGIDVSVPMDRITLVDDGRRHAGQLSIYATAGDPARAPARVLRVPLEVEFPRQQLAAARTENATYTFELTSAEAPKRVAITVRDDFGPTSATLGLDVQPPPEMDPASVVN